VSPNAKTYGILGFGAFVFGSVMTVVAYSMFGPKGAAPTAGHAGHAVSPRSQAAPVAAGTALSVATPGPRHHPAWLRAAHGDHGKRVVLIPAGATVKVVGHAHDEHGHRWYQVAVGEHAGWMHGDVLT